MPTTCSDTLIAPGTVPAHDAQVFALLVGQVFGSCQQEEAVLAGAFETQ